MMVLHRRPSPLRLAGALLVAAAATALTAGFQAASAQVTKSPPPPPPANVMEAPSQPPPAPAPEAQPRAARPGVSAAGTPKAGSAASAKGGAPAPSAPGGAPGTGPGGMSSILGSPDQKDGMPVSVEADQGIEWQQEKQLYIARGNAKATRGDVTVYGQVLTAYYRKTPSGGSDIWRLEANDAVKITAPNETALGDKAIYDVDSGIFVLTGKNLQLDSPRALITAKDSLEYWQKQQYAVARGDAKAVREDRTVRGDVLEAHFRPDKKGELQISNIEAFRNVEITTQNAVARALYGDYNLDSGIAVLRGSVKITRGSDQLNGECAEFNVNTNISRIFSCDKREQVRGLLVPKKGQDQGILPTAPEAQGTAAGSGDAAKGKRN